MNVKNSNSTKLSSNYNGSFDFLKFLFSIVIFMFHCYEVLDFEDLFKSGAEAVEFFFILSGYFMAVSINRKNSTEITSLGKETVSFVGKKLKGILPYYLFAFACSFITYLIWNMSPKLTVFEYIEKLVKMIPNFLLLSSTGVMEVRVLGLAWYISAMLIAMTMLYPIMRKYKSLFFNLIAPLAMILLSGFLSDTFGNLYLDYKWKSILPLTLLRAFFGLIVGCCAYSLSEAIKKLKLTKFSKIILSIIEYSLYCLVFYAMIVLRRNFVFVVVYALLFAVSITASRQGILSGIFNNKLIKSTNRFSLAFYLCHSSCRQWFINADYGFNSNQDFIAILVSSLILTFICMVVIDKLTPIIAQKRIQMKKIFVNKVK